jgi:hypothetical protein
MARTDYTAQSAPAPEGPGLHSYDAAPPAPETSSAELWATSTQPEPEAEL